MSIELTADKTAKPAVSILLEAAGFFIVGYQISNAEKIALHSASGSRISRGRAVQLPGKIVNDSFGIRFVEQATDLPIERSRLAGFSVDDPPIPVIIAFSIESKLFHG